MRPRIIRVLCVVGTCLVGPALAGFSGSDIFLPMAGRKAGVHPSNWYTTVWIHNPGDDAATARISFLQRDTANLSPPTVDVLVGPGDTEKLENVVESLFHLQAFGALRVTCTAEKLVVTSRVYSNESGASEAQSVGQDAAGIPASFAIGRGEKGGILGVHQTLPAEGSEYRYNFGFVETTGHSVTVRVTAFDGNNALQGSKEFTVSEWSQRQVAFKDHFPGVSTENSRLEIEVIAGEGRVIAFGSMVANRTQDPTTFEMAYADSLLGATVVQHDGTLVGDGSAGAPLGLADGAVSSAKLADRAVTLTKLATTNTPEATPGGYLHSDGSTLAWSAAALELPFRGSGAQEEPAGLFEIANTGTGFAIAGLGAWEGVRGRTTGEIGSSGVHGIASAGAGVRGTAAPGYGVWGEGQVGGVYGVGQEGVRGVNLTHNETWGYLGGQYGVYGVSGSNKSGVFGTGRLEGVRGESVGDPEGAGVVGYANTGKGVRGYASHGYGVWGEGLLGGVYGIAQEGVRGVNSSNNAIFGYLGGDYGVFGAGSTLKAGVFGTGPLEGVRGETTGGEEASGVVGKATTGSGVLGTATYGSGVRGRATVGYGVSGEGGIGGVYGCCHPGVLGESTGGEGVVGRTAAGIGVRGISKYIAVLGETDLNTGVAVKGSNSATGSWGSLGGTSAVVGHASSANYAGEFFGDVRIWSDLDCWGCVPHNGISPEGATNGQVLKFNGTEVVWGTDFQGGAFTLPVAESGSAGGALFAITNTGSGPALKGSATGYGVEGVSSGGVGVYGHGASGVGALGQSIDGLGVYGLSTSASGVYGRSSTGAGVEGYGVSSYGVYGHSDNHDGVRAKTSAAGRSGVYAEAMDAKATAVAGVNVSGTAGSLGGDYGVWGNGGPGGVAGFFEGHMYITGLGGSGSRPVYVDDKGRLHASTSDSRLKRDVVDLSAEIDVLSAMVALRGVAFSWDTSQERAKDLGGQREIGMIAQEVEALLPQVVGETADGYKTLDYAKLTAFLVEVVKAQQAQISAQEERLCALEAVLTGR